MVASLPAEVWLKAAAALGAFAFGAAVVQRRKHVERRAGRGTAFAAGLPGAEQAGPVDPPAAAPPAPARPASQVPVRSFDTIVADSGTSDLLASIERRTRLTPANFAQDCLPLLRGFAEYVQFLPASECHHHAQPGGLWVHALEVVDAALAFRAGLEMPAGALTEDRKRLEHRLTYAVFAGALLHDVGKPVTDVVVTLYGDDPNRGWRWSPLAGAMLEAGARFYRVGFAETSARNYQAHGRLAAMQLMALVPGRVLRWLGEDGDVLTSLVAYLSGEEPDGAIGSIVKRADSDSVRRNLLAGPRTRFATARTVPLIERLMRALRRMLAEGGSLPLNRPGAAGWVHEGHVWFVCARLADEVRKYLAHHESVQGIPGEDRNDRLFDTWQEYGLLLPAPDGGAVWRVRVRCESWSPPQVLTVLCFPLARLYADAAGYPAAMRGSVTPVDQGTGAPPVNAVAATGSLAAAPASQLEATTAAPACQSAQELPRPPNSAAGAAATSGNPANANASTTASTTVTVTVTGAAADDTPPSLTAAPGDDDTLLPTAASATAEFEPVQRTSTPELGAPLRPADKGRRPAGSMLDGPARSVAGEGSGPAIPASPKGPSPAATAFMAWVAQSVASSHLRYNEDGAMVHFVPEGVLLLSPELFRRFLAEHAAVPDGPVAQLRQSFGERAFARLQNELARSGWTQRNGDENLHYYSFTKADGSPSRPAAFYLIREPQRLWNPVPPANDRVRAAQRPARPVHPLRPQQAPKTPPGGAGPATRSHP